MRHSKEVSVWQGSEVAQAVRDRKTLIRELSGGVVVGYADGTDGSSSIAAIVDPAGAFRIVKVTWDGYEVKSVESWDLNRVDADGMTLRDADGNLIAKFGSSEATVGRTDGKHVTISLSGMQVQDGNITLATVDETKFELRSKYSDKLFSVVDNGLIEEAANSGRYITGDGTGGLIGGYVFIYYGSAFSSTAIGRLAEPGTASSPYIAAFEDESDGTFKYVGFYFSSSDAINACEESGKVYLAYNTTTGKIEMTSSTGSDAKTYTANMVAVLPADTTLRGRIHAAGIIYREDDREVFNPRNTNGNTVIGYGNYDAGDGDTNIYGNNVWIRAKNGMTKLVQDSSDFTCAANGTTNKTIKVSAGSGWSPVGVVRATTGNSNCVLTGYNLDIPSSGTASVTVWCRNVSSSSRDGTLTVQVAFIHMA